MKGNKFSLRLPRRDVHKQMWIQSTGEGLSWSQYPQRGNREGHQVDKVDQGKGDRKGEGSEERQG